MADMKKKLKEAEKKAKASGVLQGMDYKALLKEVDESKLGKAAARKMTEQKK